MICIMSVLWGWKYVSSNGDEEAIVYEPVEYTVGNETLRIAYSGDGEVELSTLNLDFEVSGTVDELLVSEGDWIEEEVILATLDKADYETSYEKAMNSYQEALLNRDQTIAQDKLDQLTRADTLKQLNIVLEQAKAEYDRNQLLTGVVSENEIEDSRIVYERATSDYETQKAYNSVSDVSMKKIELANIAVETAQLSLREAEENLMDTELMSPSKGKVLALNFSEGEAFSSPDSNSSATEHFMVLLDSDEVEIIAPISEIDIESVFEDQEVEIIFEAFPSKIYHGKVMRVEDIPTSSSGMVTYDAIIQMTDADESIKDGMTCEIEFILTQRINVVTIPNKAVTYEDGNQYVDLINAQGDQEKTVIKTGLTDGKMVEVTEGLSKGDVVVYQTVSKE